MSLFEPKKNINKRKKKQPFNNNKNTADKPKKAELKHDRNDIAGDYSDRDYYGCCSYTLDGRDGRQKDYFRVASNQFILFSLN